MCYGKVMKDTDGAPHSPGTAMQSVSWNRESQQRRTFILLENNILRCWNLLGENKLKSSDLTQLEF